jgi:uncharacterized coiled-coil protein SlyX
VRRFRRRPELRVESFELVEVGSGLSLVRLAGEWRSGVPSRVRLIAAARGDARHLPALPEPPGGGGGLWRAAFSAEGDVGGARFRLHTDDGRSVTLPQPVVRGAGKPPVASEPAPVPLPPVRTESPAPPGLTAPPAHSAPHSDSPRAERERAARTEASLREQLRIMVNETAEFMGRLEGYELRRSELEKELSWERLLHRETRRMLERAERERDKVGARVEETGAARRQLDAARERIDELEKQVEEQERLLGGLRTSVDRGLRQFDALEGRLLALRKEAAASGERRSGPAMPAAFPELLDGIWIQADRGTERLAALERRLMELRAEVV